MILGLPAHQNFVILRSTKCGHTCCMVKGISDVTTWSSANV